MAPQTRETIGSKIADVLRVDEDFDVVMRYGGTIDVRFRNTHKRFRIVVIELEV